MYDRNVTVSRFEKTRKGTRIPSCNFENIKKNHNDDGIIVWYNVGQSGGNKG